MGVAEELLEQYKAGIARIQLAIANNEQESSHLEFKGVHETDPTQGRFPQGLRKHLAQCASAFANTDGGILVWGIDARDKQPLTLRPIVRLAEFTEAVNRLSLDIVEPVTAMEHFPVKTGSKDEGILISYVPRGLKLPVMATFDKDNRYYIRAADRTVSITDGAVRNLMMGGASPKLGWRVIAAAVAYKGIAHAPIRVAYPPGIFKITAHLALANEGVAPGRNVAFLMEHECARYVHRIHEHLHASTARNFETNAEERLFQFEAGFTAWPSTISPAIRVEFDHESDGEAPARLVLKGRFFADGYGEPFSTIIELNHRELAGFREAENSYAAAAHRRLRG